MGGWKGCCSPGVRVIRRSTETGITTITRGFFLFSFVGGMRFVKDLITFEGRCVLGAGA